MRSLVTVSYTTLDAGGGVPKFNRDLHAAFPGGRHYCWWDVAEAFGIDPNAQDVHEWEKAKILNRWLLSTDRLNSDHVVVCDNWWADRLDSLPHVVSVAHGNWSHTTASDVAKGVLPEFPMHAAVQLDFRRRWLRAGKKMTAVSDFIADQMKLQWGLEVDAVIDNGIDAGLWKPVLPVVSRRTLIVHGVTTANKGYEHIQAVKSAFPNDLVMSLDEAANFLEMDKPSALASADLVVFPSAHEGNSFFYLEALACNVPVFAYDVGLAYRMKQDCFSEVVGEIADHDHRTPQLTVQGVTRLLERIRAGDPKLHPRRGAELHTLERFKAEWTEFFRKNFGKVL